MASSNIEVPRNLSNEPSNLSPNEKLLNLWKQALEEYQSRTGRQTVQMIASVDMSHPADVFDLAKMGWETQFIVKRNYHVIDMQKVSKVLEVFNAVDAVLGLAASVSSSKWTIKLIDRAFHRSSWFLRPSKHSFRYFPGERPSNIKRLQKIFGLCTTWWKGGSWLFRVFWNELRSILRQTFPKALMPLSLKFWSVSSRSVVSQPNMQGIIRSNEVHQFRIRL